MVFMETFTVHRIKNENKNERLLWKLCVFFHLPGVWISVWKTLSTARTTSLSLFCRENEQCALYYATRFFGTSKVVVICHFALYSKIVTKSYYGTYCIDANTLITVKRISAYHGFRRVPRVRIFNTIFWMTKK